MTNRPTKEDTIQALGIISAEQYRIAPAHQRTPLHIHLATKIFATGLPGGTHVVMRINVTLDNLKFRCSSWTWIFRATQSKARELEINLDFCANPLQNTGINLLEQHLEL